MPTLEAIRDDSRKEAVNNFGTYYIFRNRVAALKWRLRLLVFLGLLVPLSIGASTLSFGFSSSFTALIMSVALTLGFVQAIVSLWALTSRWDDEFAYVSESMTANRALYEKFRTLSEKPPKLEDAQRQYDLLQAENQARSAQDEKLTIKDAEVRMGTRAALRELRIKCIQCEQVPADMQPSECRICGNYSRRLLKL